MYDEFGNYIGPDLDESEEVSFHFSKTLIRWTFAGSEASCA